MNPMIPALIAFAAIASCAPASAAPAGVLEVASEIKLVAAESTHLVRIADGADVVDARLVPALSITPANERLANELGLDRFFFVRGDRAERDAVLSMPWIRSSAPAGIGTQTDVVVGNNSSEPMLSLQYAIKNIGQSINGVPGGTDADMDVSEAWTLVDQDEDVIVAVLDSGVDLDHTEFHAKIVPGYNATTIGADDQYDATEDSHGTHVAGVIAASKNGVGTIGVAPNARIMPVKVVAFGFVFEQWLAEGIVWATDNGAEVISMSLEVGLGGNADSSLLAAAVQYAHESNVVLVGSSGNVPGQNVVYPARFPTVIAVGATDNTDTSWDLTSTGPELSVVAPGVDVLSTWNDNSYDYLTGTSAAAPQVAGAAALIKAVKPDLKPELVKRLIEENAEDRGEFGWDSRYGNGRVNSLRAVAAALGINACPADVNQNGRTEASDFTVWLAHFNAGNADADLNLDGSVDPADFTTWLRSFAEGCD